MSRTFPVDEKLRDGLPVQLVLADKLDIELLRSLYRVIVEEGTSYPHDQFPLVSRQGRGVSSDSFIFWIGREPIPGSRAMWICLNIDRKVKGDSRFVGLKLGGKRHV